MTRKAIFVGVLLAAFWASQWVTGPALASDINWKMSLRVTLTSPEGKAHQRFADLVKAKSKGKMTITIYPAEQLGKVDASLEQLKTGLIQIMPEASSFLQKYDPRVEIAYLSFNFSDRNHWIRFLESEMVRGWYDSIAKNHNIMILGKEQDFMRGPYRVMVSKKQVNGLEDIKGMKIRIHPAEKAVAVWKYLGANVIILAWTETYEALGRGTIDALTSPISLVESMKFYEQAKYVIKCDEVPQGVAYMTNYKQFQELSPELQKVLLESHKEAAAYATQLAKDDAELSLVRMEKEGVKFSEMDLKPFVIAIRPLYQKWEEEGKLPAGTLQKVADLATK